MGKFKYKGVDVNVYKEDTNHYNVETDYDGVELLGYDNLFIANSMKQAEQFAKKAISRELKNYKKD